MFIRLRKLTSASCQSMAHTATYYHVNLYTIIRVVRPSTCNVVRDAFGLLIRLEHLIISKRMDGSDSYMVSGPYAGGVRGCDCIPLA